MTGEYEFAKGGGKKPFQIGENSRGGTKPQTEKIQKPPPSNLLTEFFKKKHKVHPQGK